MRYSDDQRIIAVSLFLEFLSGLLSAKIRLDLETLAQLDQSYEEEETQHNEMYWDCEPSFIQLGDPILNLWAWFRIRYSRTGRSEAHVHKLISVWSQFNKMRTQMIWILLLYESGWLTPSSWFGSVQPITVLHFYMTSSPLSWLLRFTIRVEKKETVVDQRIWPNKLRQREMNSYKRH